MGRIYKDQTKVRFRITCGIDLSEVSVATIKYIKADETTGDWTATVEDVENGIIYYDVVTGDLDVAGKWKMWAYLIFVDLKTAPGEPFEIYVFDEGQIYV